MKLLKKVKEEHGDNAIVTIRVDDYGVTVEDVVTRKMLYDADTLTEFTHRFHAPADDKRYCRAYRL